MRGLGPGEENDFTLMASAQILDMFNQLTGDLLPGDPAAGRPQGSSWAASA
jgi:hypothetical protein